jgi:hypothetical protein
MSRTPFLDNFRIADNLLGTQRTAAVLLDKRFGLLSIVEDRFDSWPRRGDSTVSARLAGDPFFPEKIVNIPDLLVEQI